MVLHQSARTTAESAKARGSVTSGVLSTLWSYIDQGGDHPTGHRPVFPSAPDRLRAKATLDGASRRAAAQVRSQFDDPSPNVGLEHEARDDRALALWRHPEQAHGRVAQVLEVLQLE